MTESKHIKQYLKEMPSGKPFAEKALYHLTSMENARQVLTRLVKQGELRRVVRGVFVKPHYVAGVGEAVPSTREITEVIARSTGETIAIHGAEAARQLHLTTQVPMQTIYYTNGTSRTLRLGKRTVQLKHVSPKKLRLSGTLAGTFVSALSYLGRAQVTPETITTIKRHLPEQEFHTIMQQTEHMPCWIAGALHRYQLRQEHG